MALLTKGLATLVDQGDGVSAVGASRRLEIPAPHYGQDGRRATASKL
jgi:hypothetical protein